MNPSFQSGFRILEQKRARGYSAIPSASIQTGNAVRSRREGARKRLFGFRNRKLVAGTV
jgi:hypothetical protein